MWTLAGEESWLPKGVEGTRYEYVLDKLRRSNIQGWWSGYYLRSRCILRTVMGSLENGGSGSSKAGRAKWIWLTVWNQNKAENRPASGKIDVKRMKAKCQLCLMISNPLLFNPILHSHWALTMPASLYVWFLSSTLATKERKCHHHLKFRIWNLRDEGICQGLSAGGWRTWDQKSAISACKVHTHTPHPSPT